MRIDWGWTWSWVQYILIIKKLRNTVFEQCGSQLVRNAIHTDRYQRLIYGWSHAVHNIKLNKDLLLEKSSVRTTLWMIVIVLWSIRFVICCCWNKKTEVYYNKAPLSVHDRFQKHEWGKLIFLSAAHILGIMYTHISIWQLLVFMFDKYELVFSTRDR